MKYIIFDKEGLLVAEIQGVDKHEVTVNGLLKLFEGYTVQEMAPDYNQPRNLSSLSSLNFPSYVHTLQNVTKYREIYVSRSWDSYGIEYNDHKSKNGDEENDI